MRARCWRIGLGTAKTYDVWKLHRSDADAVQHHDHRTVHEPHRHRPKRQHHIHRSTRWWPQRWCNRWYRHRCPRCTAHPRTTPALLLRSRHLERHLRRQEAKKERNDRRGVVPPIQPRRCSKKSTVVRTRPRPKTGSRRAEDHTKRIRASGARPRRHRRRIRLRKEEGTG